MSIFQQCLPARPTVSPLSPLPFVAAAPRASPGGVGGNRLQHVGDLYGACPNMRKLFATIRRIAPTSATAMILGESGTGKELVARAIHDLSPRRDGPFVAVNCGALPENLIESELFGHERGSFTGATRTHRGCFERAGSGTLFLDEIVEMPVDLQVRLLRVLETGRYVRVGGDRELVADARVIAASNRDLRAAVASGRLREDLMYRLCVIPVLIAPLRERKDDAVLLAERFLAELNAEHAMDKAFTASARERIAAHRWPGNVRELRNVVHRSFLLSEDAVDLDFSIQAATDAGLGVDAGSSVGMGAGRGGLGTGVGAGMGTMEREAVSIPVGTSLDEAERTLIYATLRSVSGCKVKAARILGVSLKTLYNRLQAYRTAADGVPEPPPKRLVLVEAA